ncbi:MAG: metallophosphoesterase [Cyclobacteriaceae bacterium]|nr:metallophosphoesterase [Cyclobacteriaceae bacterium]
MVRGWWIICLFLGGCIFEFHPYEIRLTAEKQNLNAKAITRIQATVPHDTLRIALIADTQRAYDELSMIVRSANAQTYDFMLIAGDIAEYGLQWEYDQIFEILKDLKKPFVSVIGNHDYQGDGRHIFNRMYGPTNDWFRYGRFNFILHDTNSREHNFSGLIPDLSFLSNHLADSLTNLVIGHISPFSPDFDPNIFIPYTQLLNDRAVLLGVYGHDHSFKILKDEHTEVTYVVCPAPDKRFYLMLTVWSDDFELERIYY